MAKKRRKVGKYEVKGSKIEIRMAKKGNGKQKK